MALLAIAAAGCTSGNTPPQKVGGEPTPSISIPQAGQPTGIMERAQEAQPKKPFDLSRVRWAEYTAAPDRHTTIRLELYGTGFPGVKKIERTVESSDLSYIRTLDGGSLFRMHASRSSSSAGSGWLASFEQLKEDDPVLCSEDASSSISGSETVIVPLGTFKCYVYRGSFKGSEAIYWGATDIPVPIKVYTAYDGSTLELTGWG